MKKNKKVLVAMSGGLDSSVAMALLKKEGYECIGVYMNLWADKTIFNSEETKNFPQNKCCSIESLMIARSVCQSLDAPFYVLDFENDFKDSVVNYFLEGFKKGETPNPCVECNKKIKFGLLFKKMEELGCDFLATGHYALIKKDKNGEMHLYSGKDESKDQTYFLYNLTQEKLKKVLFPIGKYTKPKVREMARKLGLKEVAEKRESQGVCFYPEKTGEEFLKRYLTQKKDYKSGQIQDTNGKIVGEHKGLPFYTIGQRKGICIGGGPALYVNKMDHKKNLLYIGDENELFTQTVELKDVNFLSGELPKTNSPFSAKIRSQGKLSEGKLIKKDKKIYFKFNKPERAIMAGQSLVLYKGKELVGGGLMVWYNK
ncbi:MAG: tRNA 2-thiouridine(34) synthase MnmA [Candidatus Gracilibacteria bacterium]